MRLETVVYRLPRSMFRCLKLVFILVFAIGWAVDGRSALQRVVQGSLAGEGLATITTPDGAIIYAEIADTPAKRAEGLMFRTTMPPDHGMLFTFPESGHWTFWMKNTKIPLDIIWLDGKGKVVYIKTNVPICTRTDEGCPRYHPLKKALYVLELKAGMAERLEILKGTRLSISLP